MQLLEGEPRDHHHGLGDVAVAGSRLVDPVPEGGALQRTARHAVEVHLAGEVVVDEQAEPEGHAHLPIAVACRAPRHVRVAVAGGVGAAVRRTRGKIPHGLKIEIEVDSLAQLEEALDAGADIILLDNFSLGDIEKAVALARICKAKPLLEVSGGVTLERIANLARTGVDIVSAGALTHSAPAVDLALDIAVDGADNDAGNKVGNGVGSDAGSDMGQTT